jgi:8-oxo-dGTP pyrophosphatase MutT (NUDIX family)
MHKPSDPGRWDNLAGGMVAAAEEDLGALAREAHEEAGLQLAGLVVVRGSGLPVQRMVAEGLMIETVQVFDVTLPEDYVPRNLDGEVAAFDRRSIAALLDAIERGDFTLEAALTTLDGLQRAILGREMR